jgi:hypothetical protein
MYARRARSVGAAQQPVLAGNNLEKVNRILLSLSPNNVAQYQLRNSRLAIERSIIGRRKLNREIIAWIPNANKRRVLLNYSMSPMRPSRLAKSVTYALNTAGYIPAAEPGQMVNVKKLAQLLLTYDQKTALKRVLVDAGYKVREADAIANSADIMMSDLAGPNRRAAAKQLATTVFEYMMLPGNATARGANIKGGLWNFAVEKLGSKKWFKAGIKFKNIAERHPRKTKAGALLAAAYVGHAVGSKVVRNTARVVKGSARATKHVVTHHPRKVGAALAVLIAHKLWSKIRGQRRNRTPSPRRNRTPSPRRNRTPSPRRNSPIRLSPVASAASANSRVGLFLGR